MTLSISHWPWLEGEQHAADRLQVRLRITPPFNGTLQAGNESNGLVQTFTLTGQALPPFIEKLLNGRQLVRRVRLVDAVELDSQVVVTNTTALAMLGAERSKVEFALNITTSELVLSFGHFNSTLVYDPGTLIAFRFSFFSSLRSSLFVFLVLRSNLNHLGHTQISGCCWRAEEMGTGLGATTTRP
jgi:hypothetical protein